MNSPNRVMEILRDFLEVHRRVRELASAHRSGGLRFPELEGLIRDDEGSVLFRLKERSHALFRDPAREGRAPSHREALFDLAVGSLFHEAMKLRENLYQRDVYGPRVRALRTEAGEESKALFDEFEKVLSDVGQRLDEGMNELEALAQQTADQLRLLIAHGSDAATARFMTEREADMELVFGTPLPELMSELYGSVASGYERAGRAYLASGSFAEAADRFERVLAESAAAPGIEALRDYARGMQAYVARDYSEGVSRLAAWARAEPRDPGLLRLARDVAASIVQLACGDDRTRVSGEASDLLEHLGPAPDRDHPPAS